MMSEYVIVERKNHLLMNISGRFSYWEFIGYPEIIRRQCESSKINRIIVDVAAVEFREVSTLELFFLGEKLAEHLGRNIKIALVWSGKKGSEFFENVASNRQANIRIFTKTAPARLWLLFDHEDEPPAFRR